MLDNTLPDSNVISCVVAHNSEWISFFELTPELMRQRLKSGELFLGVYKQGSLVGYLETMSHHVEIPNMPVNLGKLDAETVIELAYYVSLHLRGNYFTHAPNGLWPNKPVNANVIRFVSINVLPQERDFGYGGQMIQHMKMLMSKPKEERPEQLRNIEVSLTDTPVKPLPQRFHLKYGALDTQYIEQGFRPGYDMPDIKRFCYPATF